MSAQNAIYSALTALDNQDAPLEKYPDRLIEALARAGFAVVPVALPHEVLGAAAMHGVAETGNPKHCWDYLLMRVQVGPDGVALGDGAERRVEAHIEKRRQERAAEPQLVGYDECCCILTQYCDGTCQPVFAMPDVLERAQAMYAEHPTYRGTRPLSWREAPVAARLEWVMKAKTLPAGVLGTYKPEENDRG